jgi:hypothetical protein
LTKFFSEGTHEQSSGGRGGRPALRLDNHRRRRARTPEKVGAGGYGWGEIFTTEGTGELSDFVIGRLGD